MKAKTFVYLSLVIVIAIMAIIVLRKKSEPKIEAVNHTDQESNQTIVNEAEAIFTGLNS
ncbi:MAG: hypothetical protein Kow0068_20880 [Marinilabiliales bacterium]